MLAAAPWCVHVGDCRWIGSAPRPVIAGDGPQVTCLGLAATGIKDGAACLVGEELGGAFQDRDQPLVHGPQLERREADPMGERGTIDVDPFGCHHLRLAVQRQVPRVFADDDVGDERLGRQTAFDQPRGGRRLDDARRHVGSGALAGSAGVFRSPGHDHPVFGRDLVETLGTILADHMEIVPTAGAHLARRLDDDLLARQMGREMAAIDFACLPARR